MNPELLLDIAKLIRKYPPDVWEEFLHELNSRAFRDKLMYAVSELRKLSYESRSYSQHVEHTTGSEAIYRRAILLNQVRSDLRKRRIVEIREYAESLGIAFDRRASKELLVRKILRALTAKDIDEIKKTRAATLFDRPVKQDYERWGELIMGRKTKASPRR
jgi:hypothetical protein